MNDPKTPKPPKGRSLGDFLDEMFGPVAGDFVDETSGPRNLAGDPIASIPAEDFTIGVRIRMYSEQEIAHWIRSNRLTGKQKMEFLQTLAEFNGAGPMPGIIRTALREVEGLPPIPGDEV